MTPETNARDAFASFRFSAVPLSSEDHEIAVHLSAEMKSRYSDPSKYHLSSLHVQLPPLEQVGAAMLWVVYEDYGYYNNSGSEMTEISFYQHSLLWQIGGAARSEPQQEPVNSSVSSASRLIFGPTG